MWWGRHGACRPIKRRLAASTTTHLLRYLPPVYFPVAPTQLLAALMGTAAGGERAQQTAVNALADRFGARAVALTASGTMALQLAITASASGRRPTVALPAYGCPDLGTAALGANAQVLLYDLDPATLQPDWDSFAAALESGATHAVLTHLYGRVTDVPTARALAAAHGTVIIEDSAQGADASLHGQPCGALAEWSILSLGRGKGVNAGGGGVLLGPSGSTSAEPLLSLASTPAHELSHAAKAFLTELLSHPRLYGLPARITYLGIGETVFHPPRPLSAISAIAANLLPSSLVESAARAPARRAAEQDWLAALADHPSLQLPSSLAGAISGALRTPMLAPPSLVAGLGHFGVVRSYPRPLDAYPAIAAVIGTQRKMPGAAILSTRLFTLPTHARVTPSDRLRILRRLRTGAA